MSDATDVIKAKHISGIHTYGEWEMKRGMFRAVIEDQVNGSTIFSTFLISEKTLLTALKASGVKFVTEQKRKYTHLKIKGAE